MKWRRCRLLGIEGGRAEGDDVLPLSPLFFPLLFSSSELS